MSVNRLLEECNSITNTTTVIGFDISAITRVRWQGQSWAADNLEPEQPLAPGTQVVVMGRAGTRLQVLASKVEP